MATVLTITLAVAAAFPYAAVRFRAKSETPPSHAGAAFITLTEKQEQDALAAAKASWQGNAGGFRRLRIDLALGELPTEKPRPVLDTPESTDVEHLLSVPYVAGAALPSAAAKPPVRLSPDTQKPTSPAPFSRKDLLKID